VHYFYNVKAVVNGVGISHAKVIAIIDEKKEIILDCCDDGSVNIKTDLPLQQICCVSSQKSGVVSLKNNSNNIIVVEMKEISSTLLKSVDTIGTFGVYSTDGNGDVSFRYVGSFQEYYCTSWLPWLGISTNPNDWDGWDLNDWLPTWKGKKLLVPTRYQIFHQSAYGYSISSSLFLTSVY
jgi:hypothetical protein